MVSKVELMKRYYQRRAEIEREVNKYLRGRNIIVYGGRALNQHLPSYLDRHTEDFDIYSRQPKRNAILLDRQLDKKMGGNYFKVEPAQHKGTYKVKSRITKIGVADFTKQKGRVPYVEKKNIRYVTLPFIKKGIKKTLRDKSARYRHDKDREAFNRIMIFENLRRKHGSSGAKRRMRRYGGLVSMVRIPRLKKIRSIKW